MTPTPLVPAPVLPSRPSRAVVLAVAAALLTLPVVCLAAGRLALVEENDGIGSNSDRHYTQGLRISYLFPEVEAESWLDDVFAGVGRVIPTFKRGDEATARRLQWIVIGQSLFTPDDVSLSTPDPKDRPYAAWLHSGVALLQENDRRSLSNLELLAGVIGPAAIGREIQDGFHELFGYPKANGWRHQIGNRPAFQLSYDYKHKFGMPFGESGYGFDVIPEGGLSAGNVFDYGQASLLLRIGNGLDADYGPERIRPALSGTAYTADDRVGDGFRWYVYFGGQIRGILHNEFIDGADGVSPRELHQKSWVPDGVVGASAYVWRRIRADVMFGWRGEEFNGQHGHDNLAGVNVSFPL